MSNLPSSSQKSQKSHKVSNEDVQSIIDLVGRYSIEKGPRFPVHHALRFYNGDYALKHKLDYRQCEVREVRWFKESKGLQREFVIIIAEVTQVDSISRKKQVYFRLDRTCYSNVPPREMQPNDVLTKEVLDSPVWTILLFDPVDTIIQCGHQEWAEHKDKIWPVMQKRLQQDWERQRRLPLGSLSNWIIQDPEESTSPTSVYISAVDCLSRLSDKKPCIDKDLHLYTLTFGSPPSACGHSVTGSSTGNSANNNSSPPIPYFRDVLTAASATSTCSVEPHYNVLMYQSYIYARALVTLLKDHYKDYGTALNQGDYHNWAGQFVLPSLRFWKNTSDASVQVARVSDVSATMAQIEEKFREKMIETIEMYEPYELHKQMEAYEAGRERNAKRMAEEEAERKAERERNAKRMAEEAAEWEAERERNAKRMAEMEAEMADMRAQISNGSSGTGQATSIEGKWVKCRFLSYVADLFVFDDLDVFFSFLNLIRMLALGDELENADVDQRWKIEREFISSLPEEGVAMSIDSATIETFVLDPQAFCPTNGLSVLIDTIR
ncbi:hypothetical protein CVT24_006245 [Panaeolus cyanescens]|uniref:Uncharacterized protein n=1 Tax=Panaeolus cyanescens TaxID=181874 RepID=A0A409YEH2_9AGAR|nr:hypothetical protein CVT24_006245 [Panaeolus cyanescens]